MGQKEKGKKGKRSEGTRIEENRKGEISLNTKNERGRRNSLKIEVGTMKRRNAKRGELGSIFAFAEKQGG